MPRNLPENRSRSEGKPNKIQKNFSQVLGFDFGKKRIGIASGQTITHTATPQTTLHAVNGNPDWHAITEQIQQWQPQALIVGMPYHLDGQKNTMTQAVEDFCFALKKRYKLPIVLIDERYSSAQAETQLKKNIKINQHNRLEIDKMAAAVIVQRWLENESGQFF